MYGSSTCRRYQNVYKAKTRSLQRGSLTPYIAGIRLATTSCEFSDGVVYALLLPRKKHCTAIALIGFVVEMHCASSTGNSEAGLNTALFFV